MQGSSITVPVRTMGEAVRASLARGQHLPVGPPPAARLRRPHHRVGALVAARAAWPRCSAIRFNDLARRSGFAGLRPQDGRAPGRRVGHRRDREVVRPADHAGRGLRPARSAGGFRGVPAASALAAQPLVALVVLVIGGLAAKALARLVRGTTAEAGLQQPGRARGGHQGLGLGFTIVVGRESARHRDDADQHTADRRRRGAGPGRRARLRARRAGPRGADPRPARTAGGAYGPPARAARNGARRWRPRAPPRSTRTGCRDRATTGAVSPARDGPAHGGRRSLSGKRRRLLWRGCQGATRFAASSAAGFGPISGACVEHRRLHQAGARHGVAVLHRGRPQVARPGRTQVRHERLRRLCARGRAAAGREAGTGRGGAHLASAPTGCRRPSGRGWRWAPRARCSSRRTRCRWTAWSSPSALAAELEGGGYDLILFGRMATDTASGTVGPMVAELLGLPCVTAISHLEIADGQGTARRDLEGRGGDRAVPAAGGVDRSTRASRGRGSPRSRGSWPPRRSRSRSGPPRSAKCA